MMVHFDKNKGIITLNDFLINIIKHPAFGPVAFLTGILFGNHFAIGRDRRKEFNQAATTFTSKVLSELEGLYPIPTNWPLDIDRFLRDKFPKLQCAVAEFKTFLPLKKQAAFEKAWFIYRMGKDGREIDKEDYWQYKSHLGSTIINGTEVEFDNTTTYQESFKRNISNLLDFAKMT
jgi:hypothetical protein